MEQLVQWNWTPTVERCAFVDIETQSAVDIREVGGRTYAAHPSTRICVLSMLINDQLLVWTPGRGVKAEGLVPEDVSINAFMYDDAELPDAMRVAAERSTLVAHNAVGFDSRIWARCTGVPSTWFDTLPCARAAGLPGGLDQLASRLIGRGKDPNGKRLIQMLSMARVVGGKIVYPVGTSHAWQLFARYCATDVLLLRVIYDHVRPYTQPDVFEVDRIINERGIPVDLGYTTALRQAYAALEAEVLIRFEATTEGGIDNPNSVKQVRRWLRDKGFNIASLERKELERFFENPETFFEGEDDADPDVVRVVEALRLRQSFARTGTGKLNAVFTHVQPDGTMKDQHVVCGAHTGRHTGRELQPHNFPRGTKGVEPHRVQPVTLDAVKAEAERVGVTPSDVLGSMVRGIVAADVLGIVDYGAVEARGVAWVAGEPALLNAFADPKRDVYLEFAKRIYGRSVDKKSTERWVSKQAVLGCGYQMSGGKFGAYCDVQGVDLTKAGVTADEVVKAYRANHPQITRLWQEYGHACKEVVKGGLERVYGKCRFRMNGATLEIVLPSGRPIRYHNARLAMRVPGYGGPEVETLVFDHPRGYEGYLYGGRIAENVVQGLCRDLLMDALVRLERAGFRPVLHVHDEAVCHLREREQLRGMVTLMSTPPAWAHDFPILVEGFTSSRYTKVPPPDSLRLDAFRGVVL